MMTDPASPAHAAPRPEPIRVIALGQEAAGDDGVGLAVLDRLRAEGLDGAELVEAHEATALVDRVPGCRRAVLIDAVVGGGEPGTVQVLAIDAIDTEAMSGVSTHGVGVRQALELARAVAPDPMPGDIRVVAVSIEAPRCYTGSLSPAVAAAVPSAVRVVRQLVEEG